MELIKYYNKEVKKVAIIKSIQKDIEKYAMSNAFNFNNNNYTIGVVETKISMGL